MTRPEWDAFARDRRLVDVRTGDVLPATGSVATSGRGGGACQSLEQCHHRRVVTVGGKRGLMPGCRRPGWELDADRNASVEAFMGVEQGASGGGVRAYGIDHDIGGRRQWARLARQGRAVPVAGWSGTDEHVKPGGPGRRLTMPTTPGYLYQHACGTVRSRPRNLSIMFQAPLGEEMV